MLSGLFGLGEDASDLATQGAIYAGGGATPGYYQQAGYGANPANPYGLYKVNPRTGKVLKICANVAAARKACRLAKGKYKAYPTCQCIMPGQTYPGASALLPGGYPGYQQQYSPYQPSLAPPVSTLNPYLQQPYQQPYQNFPGYQQPQGNPYLNYGTSNVYSNYGGAYGGASSYPNYGGYSPLYGGSGVNYPGQFSSAPQPILSYGGSYSGYGAPQLDPIMGGGDGSGGGGDGDIGLPDDYKPFNAAQQQQAAMPMQLSTPIMQAPQAVQAPAFSQPQASAGMMFPSVDSIQASEMDAGGGGMFGLAAFGDMDAYRAGRSRPQYKQLRPVWKPSYFAAEALFNRYGAV